MNVQFDRRLIRSAAGSRRYVLVRMVAPEAPRAAGRTPANVAFVLDRSGSMAGSKMELAKDALVRSVRMLRQSDRFAVVFYDHEIDVLVPSTAAAPEAVDGAVHQMQRVLARGNTDLSGGWLAGCEQVAAHLDRMGMARCLLLTDGLANQGIVDGDELARRARELRDRGIATSTFGIGRDFNEDLLQRMADAGGGRSYYVESAAQIADLLTGELGETLETVARGVVLRVEAGAGVEVSTLNALETSRIAERTWGIHLGDLVSRQDVSLVVTLRFPAGADGSTSRALFSLSDAGGVLPGSETDLIWTYAGHEANDLQPRNVDVVREVARLYAAEARREATELNRAGRCEDASARLLATVRRLREYAGDGEILNSILEDLDGRRAMYRAPMSAMALKSERYDAYNVSRMRDSAGKARRLTPR